MATTPIILTRAIALYQTPLHVLAWVPLVRFWPGGCTVFGSSGTYLNPLSIAELELTQVTASAGAIYVQEIPAEGALHIKWPWRCALLFVWHVCAFAQQRGRCAEGPLLCGSCVAGDKAVFLLSSHHKIYQAQCPNKSK